MNGHLGARRYCPALEGRMKGDAVCVTSVPLALLPEQPDSIKDLLT